jgi:hypothetical protein
MSIQALAKFKLLPDVSAAVSTLRAEGRRIFYTGDVNFEDQTLMRGAKFPEENIDVLVMETTRGDSPVPPGFTRRAEEERFLTRLRTALEEGAPVLVPVFALGKTQELLALLHDAKKSGALPGGFGLYVGGLSAKITGVTDRLRGKAPRCHGDLKLATCMPMEVVGGRDVAKLPVLPRTVYAISSGMMTENTLSMRGGERRSEQHLRRAEHPAEDGLPVPAQGTRH